MLIRSQDKKYLAEKVKIVIEFNIYNGLPYRISDSSDSMRNYTLGNYSTEEKAIKVLDMIEIEYGKYLTLTGRAALVRGGIDIQPNIFNIPKVFHMPNDDEVVI